jgi:quercetin dioxygenase-like cupin family protein
MEGISPIEGVTIKSVHLDNVMMTYMQFAPGSILGEHKHPHEQLTTIIAGKLELTVGEQTQLMEPGDVVTVPPNILHSAKVIGEKAIAIDAWSPVREDYKP